MIDPNDPHLQALSEKFEAEEGTHLTREAKPTQYGDITFRSALEATWAHTLDRLGVRWEYEPEMITLPSGVNYLPDFRLPDIGAWLEVKGDNVPRIEKTRELAEMLACDCSPAFTCDCRWRGGWIVIVGHPPLIRQHPGHYRRAWWAQWTTARGGTGWFVKCPHCSTAGWTTSPNCRACQHFLTGDLISPNDGEIEMAGR